MPNNIALIFVGTLMYTTPLLFAALGGVISELSGVMNIALEGIMTVGAFTGASVSYFTNSAFVGFLAAGFAGALLILLHAVACVTFRADQTISGTAINFLGGGISILLTKKLFNGSALSASAPKLPSAFPKFVSNRLKGTDLEAINAISIATLFAFLLVFFLWFFMYRTKWGLRILATGEHPAAVDSLGGSVFKIRYFCVLCSGFLAALGGAFMSISVTSSFSPVTICGQGFIALGALIFGKWTPQGAMFSCLLFGFARECTTMLGGQNGFVSQALLEMLPYVLTIAVLILFVGRSLAPKAVGVPYTKDLR
ncbi:MAG: ABC transporter permease [Oscillospiraceae bacterium]|nr:ABC transporter permease [Oscillospiraceae bacterium]